MAMLDYSGIKCPVCGVPFKQDDDIVVCPDCGAPYHRACYEKEGHCIFEEEHASGKVWEAPRPPVSPDISAEIKDRECPQCGTLNAHSALFCNRCGASLSGQPQRHNNTADIPPIPPVPPVRQNTAYGGVVPPFSFDPMGGVSPAEELDDGVTFGDASKLVKQNTAYYMPVFRYMKQTGHGKFSFCAFLFSGAWMLYRKQYKFGSIITALMFALYIGYMFLTYFVADPVLTALMAQVGADITSSAALTQEQLLAMSQLLADDPMMFLQVLLPLLCLFGMLVVMIVVGIRGNKMYMKHCVRTIRTIKESPQSTDPGIALEAKGGVNVPVTVCLFVCYMIVMYLPVYLSLLF